MTTNQFRSAVENECLAYNICYWWNQFKKSPNERYQEISALLRGALVMTYQKNKDLESDLITLFNIAGEIFSPTE